MNDQPDPINFIALRPNSVVLRCDGIEVRMKKIPQILKGTISEIDYRPEYGVERVMYVNEKWTDMTPYERECVEGWLCYFIAGLKRLCDEQR